MSVYSFSISTKDLLPLADKIITFSELDVEKNGGGGRPYDARLVCFEQNASDVASATSFNTNSQVRNGGLVQTSIFVPSLGGTCFFHVRKSLEYNEVTVSPSTVVRYCMMPYQFGKTRRGWLEVEKLKELVTAIKNQKTAKHGYIVFLFDTGDNTLTVKMTGLGGTLMSTSIDTPEKTTLEWYDTNSANYNSHVKEFMLGRAARNAYMDKHPLTLDRCAQFAWPTWQTAVMYTKLFRYIGKDKCIRGYHYNSGNKTYFNLGSEVGELVVSNDRVFISGVHYE